MSIERIQPDGLYRSPYYHHLVKATGGTTLWIAGQVATDPEGNVVGVGDFEAQTRQVYENLRLALAAGGADFSNVVKMTTLIVDYTPELIRPLFAIRAEYLGDVTPASTLVGVQALARPEYLIEVEATAVVD